MPRLPLLLGPPLGAVGLAAALRTLLRDASLAKAREGGLLHGRVEVFAAACGAPAGRAVLTPLLGLALVFTALFGLEAGRAGTAGPLAWFSLWAALYQLGGIGFVAPALWLPAYARRAAPGGLTQARVRATGARLRCCLALLQHA